MPMVLWPNNRRNRWLAGGLTLVWVLLMWVARDSPGRMWSTQLYLLGLILLVSASVGKRGQVLCGGVLAIIYGGGGIKHIPLSSANIHRYAGGVRLSWTERAKLRTLSVAAPGSFADAVVRVAEATRAAEDGSAPTTTADEQAQVTIGLPANPAQAGWLFGWIAGLAVLFGLSLGFNQPLILLPLVATPWLLHRMDPRGFLMLHGEQLWVMAPEQEPRAIPVAAVTEIRQGTLTDRLITSDPHDPVLHIALFQAGDLLKRLKERLRDRAAAGGDAAGDQAGHATPTDEVPRVQGAQAQPSNPPAEGTPPSGAPKLRCTLCGRIVPGAPAGGGVHICDLCAGRTRFEATEKGHGLTGRDPKPM